MQSSNQKETIKQIEQQMIKPELKGKTFIVVDDQFLHRERLKELFESFGMECVGLGTDGLEALELANKHKPDMVSLDILMPEMNGVEAMKKLRQEGTASVIIYVTVLGHLEALAEPDENQLQPDAVFSKADSRESFHQVLSGIFLHKYEAYLAANQGG